MTDTELSRKLTWVVWLLGANLGVMTVGGALLGFGLLPKVERAVQTAERVETRFQGFADEVQPILTAGAGKAVETIKGMDAERLSETATEKTDSLMEAAAERARKFLERDPKDE